MSSWNNTPPPPPPPPPRRPPPPQYQQQPPTAETYQTTQSLGGNTHGQFHHQQEPGNGMPQQHPPQYSYNSQQQQQSQFSTPPPPPVQAMQQQNGQEYANTNSLQEPAYTWQQQHMQAHQTHAGMKPQAPAPPPLQPPSLQPIAPPAPSYYSQGPPTSPLPNRYAPTPQSNYYHQPTGPPQQQYQQQAQKQAGPTPPPPMHYQQPGPPQIPPPHMSQMPAPSRAPPPSSYLQQQPIQPGPPPPHPGHISPRQPPRTSLHSPQSPMMTITSPTPTSKAKIDPSQIPRPPLFTRPQDQTAPIYYPKATVFGGDNVQPPPAADSRFVVEDDGNASPHLMRSTVYAMPRDRGDWRKCGEPDLGIICSPMALPSANFVQRPRMVVKSNGQQQCGEEEEEEEDWQDPQAVPLEQTFLLEKPPRCGRCNAYLNPFWNLDQQKCNLCGYVTRLQVAGNVLPLQRGTIDFKVGGPYVTRESPIVPAVVYAIDLTNPNIGGHVDVIESVVYQWVYHCERQEQQLGKQIPNIHLGIAFVGVSGIYIPREGGDFVVVPDVTEEPYCPFPLEEWTWNLAQPRGRQGFDMFLNDLRDGKLKQLVGKNRERTIPGPAAPKHSGVDTSRRGHSISCGGAALAFLADALGETGGRGVWISWRRPNYGAGSIRDRERDTKEPYRESHEAYLHKPLQRHPRDRLKLNAIDEASAKFYTDLGTKCAKSCVALDIVIHTDPTIPQSFLDLATLGELCRVSCGKAIWVNHKQLWHQAMREELLRPLLCFSGWNAILKIRCSTGLQVKQFGLNSMGVVRDGGLITDSPELELSVVTPDTHISVEFEHRVGGLPKGSNYVYIQSALLYTCIMTGDRRVRVSTLAIRVANQPADTFRSMDFGTIATFQLRHTAGIMLQSPADASTADTSRATSQSSLLERCQRMLASYRLHTKALNSPMGQLILPEKLQLLPLFCTSLIKSPLLRPSLPKRGSGFRAIVPSPRADERSFYLWCAATFSSPYTSMLMVHPNLFSVRDLKDGAGEWWSDSSADGQRRQQGSSLLRKLTQRPFVILPRTLQPTISNLADDGIYLLDALFVIYLYIGCKIPTESANQIEAAVLNGKGNHNAENIPLQRLIWQLRTYAHVGGGSESTITRPTFAPIVIVRHPGRAATAATNDNGSSDGGEWSRDVMKWMVCDTTSHEKDYVDFLCDLHRQIRTRVDSSKRG